MAAPRSVRELLHQCLELDCPDAVIRYVACLDSVESAQGISSSCEIGRWLYDNVIPRKEAFAPGKIYLDGVDLIWVIDALNVVRINRDTLGETPRQLELINEDSDVASYLQDFEDEGLEPAGGATLSDLHAFLLSRIDPS